MANASTGSAVGLVNRKLSPFNAEVQSQSLLSTNFVNLADFNEFASTANNSSTFTRFKDFSVAGQVQTVTSASSNVLQAGLPIYVNTIHIATANAFMTVFICSLILAAIAIGVFGMLYLALLAMERFHLGKEDRRVHMRFVYPSFVRAWTLRLVSLMFQKIPVQFTDTFHLHI